MKKTAKLSGQKKSIEPTEAWKFELRPGGIGVATSKAGQRVRFYYAEQRGKFWAQVAGQPFYGEWLVATGRGAGASVGDDLVAQFPGKVRKLIAQAGASVSAGDPLLLVEAMKMEFAVKAPSDGKVTKILVKEGQQLSPGDRFVEFEAGDASKGAKS